MDPLDVIALTADAVYASDNGGRLVAWNKACEQLMGFEAKRVLGRPCHEVISGQDPCGNRFCNGTCAVRNMVGRGEPVSSFGLMVLSATGERVPVRITVIALPGDTPSEHTVIHIVHESNELKHLSDLIHRICASCLSTTPNPCSPDRKHAYRKLDTLTPREREVLHLMAEGSGNEQIAGTLFISVPTVRNHVQNILRKLRVHSKLEAVALIHTNHDL